MNTTLYHDPTMGSFFIYSQRRVFLATMHQMLQPSEKLYKNLPDSPGVYHMKNTGGELLYIGKAGNLKRRVSSYFQKAHDARISMK